MPQKQTSCNARLSTLTDNRCVGCLFAAKLLGNLVLALPERLIFLQNNSWRNARLRIIQRGKANVNRQMRFDER
jgi:hypothetical protein